MQFKNFTLDPFQEEAVLAIEKQESVVVSAATGTGKTLIADYVIDKYLQSGKRIIYTAPIKALSNQKFKDFKKDYGEENVGILTGDVSINPQAPLLIMTTEIYRNMLLAQDVLIDQISYVVFDEIHYMNDPERGTVWEESIIFSPNTIRFICLSATIPNAEEFAAWMQEIKKHTVHVIRYEKRAVPLTHYVYEKEMGLTTAKKLRDKLAIPEYDDVFAGRGRNKGQKGKKGKKTDWQNKDAVASPEDVIMGMLDKLPAIVFSFSRKGCEQEAIKLIKKHDFVKDEATRKRIIEIYRKHFIPEINQMQTTAKLREALSKGVGFHHAGLLPQHKDAVEELFGEGLLQVLFATETFSVGINMPAKTVIFNGLRKYDGINFRLLNSKEYFQLAGRAGRRGIDTEGQAVAIIDPREKIMEEFIEVSRADTEPIRSQFALSYNTVLNLIAHHSPEAIEIILKSNFDYYIKKRDSTRQVRVMASFNNKKKILGKMGYISRDDALTEKGSFAKYIYFEELLITEIFTSQLYTKLNDVELLQLLAAIIYEQRSNDHFSFKGVIGDYERLLQKIIRVNPFIEKKMNKLSLKRMMLLIGSWADGAQFKDLLPLTSLAEGDIIRLFRRIIDMIGQIRHASTDYDLKERLDSCEHLIDRDLVAINF